MSEPGAKKLYLSFHGRVIDHLGIQMYQSPVAAIAELVSNAWDADAERVDITLPTTLSIDAEIILKDTGNGMTFEECQQRYLSVGYDCRAGNPTATSVEKGRPVLGRKGIGKFAGFGIAQVMTIETIAKSTGERTVFELNLGRLRGDQYFEGKTEISVTDHSEPSEDLKALHGTNITLSCLSLKRTQNADAFAQSMSRRFLLVQRTADFRILVNGAPIPDDPDLENVEFNFPNDYQPDERPDGLISETDGWGTEDIGGGKIVRWRFQFYQDTIKDEDLRGIAIFANGKLAQRPFMFNIVGGIGGQQGMEYLSGKVEADYIDRLGVDLIATERQRINWEHEEAIPLERWGRKRIDSLCRIWKHRRSADKLKAMEDKLSRFAQRLEALQKSERKTVRNALTKLAQIPSLKTKQFEELGEAILTAWEAGRLHDLIAELSDTQDMTAEHLIDLLVEANVLTALNAYEAIKTKLTLIQGLEELIEKGELENAVRDYIAENPWLVSPRWETFKKEISIKKLLNELSIEKKIDPEKEWNRRIDLILASNDTLLILEFMQPGKLLDRDHLGRFEYYINSVRNYLQANTALPYKHCIGYLVASKVDKDPAFVLSLKNRASEGMNCMDWRSLLSQAEAQFRDLLDILKERVPDDARLKQLQQAAD
jgi:Histidine kinase-, DNA gyrase B-, and HSP90-like ATPase